MAASSSARANIAVPALLVVALLLFLTGVFFPFFHVTKFWVFNDAVSVVRGIITLFHEGEYFLFAVLTLFTLVFPVVKLGLLAVIWLEREHDLARVRRLHRMVEHAGRWSMLDVFVVAILIVTMKSAAVAEIHIGLGLYLFTISIIFTQLASGWIDRLIRPAA
ncbi:MAG: paraquat-inducible protein A [Opitutaceae bacterium]|nr:paraquat-inducible protein A [Cephaloticoccus sp.]MCP5529399.1 paraquat-inducible protein A [Opitutaceae bacterium]